jgi:hypothetical protein
LNKVDSFNVSSIVRMEINGNQWKFGNRKPYWWFLVLKYQIFYFKLFFSFIWIIEAFHEHRKSMKVNTNRWQHWIISFHRQKSHYSMTIHYHSKSVFNLIFESDWIPPSYNNLLLSIANPWHEIFQANNRLLLELRSFPPAIYYLSI